MRTVLWVACAALFAQTLAPCEEATPKGYGWLKVDNRSGVPFAMRIDDPKGNLSIVPAPGKDSLPVPTGSWFRLLIRPGKLTLTWQGQATRAAIEVKEGKESSLEFLPNAAPTRPQVTVTSGGEGAYDATLEPVEAAPPVAHGEKPAAGTEAGRSAQLDYHWERTPEARTQGYWYCGTHPWVTSTSADLCPFCGRPMNRMW